MRSALWAKITSASPEESDAELWRKTLDERDQKSWLSGPYTYEELTDILAPHWIPCSKVRHLSERETQVHRRPLREQH